MSDPSFPDDFSAAAFPAASAPPSPAADPKKAIIDALMELAAERPFQEITLAEIAARAGVTLAVFRDAFPSKGAVLAGLNRQIDRAVLSKSGDDLLGEPAKERLFDVLMRRLDAMAPYREGLRAVAEWTRREPLAAAALNREAVNSMRFMLEAAGLDSEGPAGLLKLQGLVLAWTRVVDTWFDDADLGLSSTMAALDRELTRGERFVDRLDDLDRLARPLRSMMGALFERGRRFGGRRRDSREDDAPAAMV